MSGYGGGMSGGGDTDALSRRLREAERARADAERAHADALAQLRSQRNQLDAHNVEQLQSRARELEKKVLCSFVYQSKRTQIIIISPLKSTAVHWSLAPCWSSAG